MYDKELFVFVFAFEQWYRYLLDMVSTTDVLSDHWNLAFYHCPQDLNHCQAHWVATLQEYNILICHIPGCLNTPADAVSHSADRLPDGLFFDHSLPLPGDVVGQGVGLNVHSLSVDFSPLAPELQTEIVKAMTPDQINVEVTLGLQQKSPEWLTSGDGLIFCDGLVYIPANRILCAEVIQQHHDTAIAGHPRMD